MKEELNSYDWEEVFKYAGPDLATGATCSADAFSREDVAELRHCTEGENDEASWRCAGILRDGRAFYIEAWCDYTGWGCQEGGSSVVAEDWDRLVQFGMGSDARTLWGLG